MFRTLPRIADYPFFEGFNTAIPSLYFGEYTQEQRLRCICEELRKVQCYAAELGINLNLTEEAVEALRAELEALQAGGWFDIYAAELEAWINRNMERLFSLAAKMVFFGLTDDGYFCAYIPDSWSDITFDTGANYGQFDYGRLLLRYNVDGSGVIDNTGRYDEADLTPVIEELHALEHIVANVSALADKHETTLYTPMDEGGDI